MDLKSITCQTMCKQLWFSMMFAAMLNCLRMASEYGRYEVRGLPNRDAGIKEKSAN